MNSLKIDWREAPEWAQWAAQDADGSVWFFERRPAANAHREAWDEISIDGRVDRSSTDSAIDVMWTATLTQRPVALDDLHENGDHGAALRAQIDHLLEAMAPEQLDALYAHVRKQLDAAKLDELNRQLDKPFGEVPREWQLKAFEAFLDGYAVYHWHAIRGDWTDAPLPSWARDTKYRIYPKQS